MYLCILFNVIGVDIEQPLSQIITRPTISICREGSLKEQDCYVQKCVAGVWKNTNTVSNHSNCCHFWEGGCVTTTHSATSTADDGIVATGTASKLIERSTTTGVISIAGVRLTNKPRNCIS